MARIYAYGPLGAGYVDPTLGIVAELIRRGHEVTYWAPQMFSERIRETGAQSEPVTSTWEELDGGPPQMQGTEFIRAMGLLLDETAAMVPRLSPAPPPDLILHDSDSDSDGLSAPSPSTPTRSGQRWMQWQRTPEYVAGCPRCAGSASRPVARPGRRR